jgi:hypothetical protein
MPTGLSQPARIFSLILCIILLSACNFTPANEPLLEGDALKTAIAGTLTAAAPTVQATLSPPAASSASGSAIPPPASSIGEGSPVPPTQTPPPSATSTMPLPRPHTGLLRYRRRRQ